MSSAGFGLPQMRRKVRDTTTSSLSLSKIPWPALCNTCVPLEMAMGTFASFNRGWPFVLPAFVAPESNCLLQSPRLARLRGCTGGADNL